MMVVSWWKSTSSSLKLLWFMVPLILVSGLLVLSSGSSKRSYWFYNSPWVWSSLITSNNRGHEGDSGNYVAPPPEKGGDAAVLYWRWPAVSGGGGETREAVSNDYGVFNRSFSSSSSSPVAVPAVVGAIVDDQQPPVPSKNILVLNTTVNEVGVFPSMNETHALPMSDRIIQRKYSRLDKLEAGLVRARAAIRESRTANKSDNDPEYVPYGPIYLNPAAFHRSYLEMEKQFKVFVYEEGEPPIFHNGPCKSIYAMEGNFIYYMETTQFRTRDPEKAHIFFLPMSVTAMVHYIYERDSHDWRPMKQTVIDYINLISGKYPFWNRSIGADHFFLGCHDWGPELSASVPNLFKNSVRALCNANTSEGFNPSKDVSIPEILLPGGTMNGLLDGPSASRRPILVFFAGGLHGPIRPILLEHWENKDPEVQIHKYLPKGVSYYGMVRKSKYCICPSGYEVASPRMVEALYTGCVPVLIKDNYVAPFSDVLDWKSFAVEIPVKDIPNLKKILTGISSRQYIRMQRRGRQVRRHFEVNMPPRRYDVFHMILHSVWLRRLNIRIHGVDDS